MPHSPESSPARPVHPLSEAGSTADLPTDRLLALYPSLADVPPEVRADVLRHDATRVTVPAASRLFDEGRPCAGFPMVLAGEVRVARGHASGRSIELYRVGPGELCVVSTACLVGQQPLSAHGEATAPTDLVLLGARGFDRLAEHPSFRRHVFGVFGERLAALMLLTEAVAFQRLDQRLAGALLGHGPVVEATHQALADELGTVREIVTRLLKRFERAGWVRVGRERVEVVDAAALRALAGGAPGTAADHGR